MKVIENGMPIKIKAWNRPSHVARVVDMGVLENYKDWVTDENRVFGAVRPLMLCDNPNFHKCEEQKYANPIEVEDGEVVILKSNGKKYLVNNMAGGNNFDYISDILHFELVKEQED